MDLARMIDHTLLKPEAVEGDIRRLVQEAVEHRFATVCVNGRWVAAAAGFIAELGGNVGEKPVKVCAVVGFPLGAMKSAMKGAEAAAAVGDGASEIDMVVVLGPLIDGREAEVREDIVEVVRATKRAKPGAIVKVILETAALTEAQAALGCRAATDAGADFVKTSTGFHAKGGATLETVGWLAKYAPGLRVKAAGGIKDRAAAEAMVKAGATRLGTSSGIAIVQGRTATGAY